MSVDIGITIVALQRVLVHLSGEYHDVNKIDLAAARVIVRRRLAFAQREAEMLWQKAKAK